MAKYGQSDNPYSWMPSFLRRFLNLDYDDPQSSEESQGTGRTVSANYAAPAGSTARPTWLSPSEPTFKASGMESYRAPAGAPAASYEPPSSPSYTPNRSVGAGSSVDSAPAQASISLQTLIPTILGGFLHGVLPPQGVEAFTKEVYTTGAGVWNLYSRWFFVQTEGILRLGQAIIVAVTDSIVSVTPNTASPPPSSVDQGRR
ncbi:MAG: hypothetical protein WCK70_00680 [Chloroflexales bacterium]|jgi:hypothetical protein